MWNNTPEKLTSFYNRGVYAESSRGTLAVSPSFISMPAFSVGSQSPVVTDVGNSAEDVVEASIDGNRTGKEVFMPL